MSTHAPPSSRPHGQMILQKTASRMMMIRACSILSVCTSQHTSALIKGKGNLNILYFYQEGSYSPSLMKIPDEVISVWLEIMSDEDLLRFRKRLEMNLSDKLKREKRESLIDLFSAEIKRRKQK